MKEPIEKLFYNYSVENIVIRDYLRNVKLFGNQFCEERDDNSPVEGDELCDKILEYIEQCQRPVFNIGEIEEGEHEKHIISAKEFDIRNRIR